MPNLTIHNLDTKTETRLKELANRNGSTPEDEARAILDKSVMGSGTDPVTLGDLRTRFIEMTEGGVDLDPYLPKRQKTIGTVDFDT